MKINLCGYYAWGIISVVFDVRDQIFCIRQILENKLECNETVHQLLVDFKKACDSVSGEVFYDILKVGVLVKLGELIKLYLNKMHS
jgi:hypothetical protein